MKLLSTVWVSTSLSKFGYCRLVEKSWKNVIDGKNYPWERIVKRSILHHGNTNLHLAAEYGQTEMFENIFIEEIRKNPTNEYQETPFHVACKEGHFKIAEVIMRSSIESNINLNSTERRYGETGFHYACESGQVKIVELLIKN